MLDLHSLTIQIIMMRCTGNDVQIAATYGKSRNPLKACVSHQEARGRRVWLGTRTRTRKALSISIRRRCDCSRICGVSHIDTTTLERMVENLVLISGDKVCAVSDPKAVALCFQKRIVNQVGGVDKSALGQLRRKSDGLIPGHLLPARAR